MATYEVKDEQTGKTVTFDWNDPTPPTDTDMVAVFAEAHRQSKPQIGPDYSNLTADMSETQKLLAGVGKGMTDLYAGAKQRGMELGNATGIVPDASLKSYSEQIAQNKAIDAPLMDTTAGMVGNFVGGTAPLIPIPGGVGGGLLRRAGTSTLTGGLTGALQPTTEQDSTFQNIAIGGATGGVASGVLSGLGKAYNTLADKLPANFIEALSKKYGIRTTLGEATGNPHIQRAETWLERIPLIGLKGFRESQHQEADTAAKSLLGKYIFDPTAPDIMKTNRAYAGSFFDRLSEKAGEIKVQKIQPTETRNAAIDVLDRYPDIFKKFQDTKREKIIGNIIDDTAPSKDPYAVLSSLYGVPSTGGQPTTITFKEAWELRDGLGQMINQAKKKLNAGDVDKTQYAELSRLYASINNDIDKWGASIKRPDIREAITVANDSYKKYVVKYDIIQRAYDKASGVSSAKEMFSPKTFSTELKKIVYKDKAFGSFAPTEIDELTGLANILQVVKRAGQYMENPPTGDRWGIPLLGMGTTALSPKAAITAGSVVGITRFLTGTEPGKRLAMSASRIEPTNPNMKVIIKMVYNQLPKMTASIATE
jgi:hypothetical protein